MINFDEFSDEVFNLLKSYGKDMVLYDEQGNRTYEPTEARRLFITGVNFLVTITDKGNNSTLSLRIGDNANLSQISGLIESLRGLAIRSNVIFNVKKHDGTIQPKDFSTPMNESAIPVGEHTVNVQHYGDISSGYIEDVAIVNPQGDIIKTDSVTSAIGLATHVNNGGSYVDSVADEIRKMADNFRIFLPESTEYTSTTTWLITAVMHDYTGDEKLNEWMMGFDMEQRSKKKTITESTSYQEWQKEVFDQYPELKDKISFFGRVEGGKSTVSAEVKGQDRSYGVFDIDSETGEVLESVEEMIEDENQLVESEKESLVLKADDVTADYIKELIGNDLRLFTWDVDNGGLVKAQVKTTTRNGLIHTKYLHITLVEPNGNWKYYREQRNGNLALVSSGNDKREKTMEDEIQEGKTFRRGDSDYQAKKDAYKKRKQDQQSKHAEPVEEAVEDVLEGAEWTYDPQGVVKLVITPDQARNVLQSPTKELAIKQLLADAGILNQIQGLDVMDMINTGADSDDAVLASAVDGIFEHPEYFVPDGEYGVTVGDKRDNEVLNNWIHANANDQYSFWFNDVTSTPDSDYAKFITNELLGSCNAEFGVGDVTIDADGIRFLLTTIADDSTVGAGVSESDDVDYIPTNMNKDFKRDVTAKPEVTESEEEMLDESISTGDAEILAKSIITTLMWSHEEMDDLDFDDVPQETLIAVEAQMRSFFNVHAQAMEELIAHEVNTKGVSRTEALKTVGHELAVLINYGEMMTIRLDEPELGDAIEDLERDAHNFNGFELYIGDDGKVYIE